jgi:uridine phosphorylase
MWKLFICWLSLHENHVPMSPVAKPDLIVNADGSVYHLCMRPEDLADTVIVVGDPERVSDISSRFTRVESRRSNREFISHTGEVRGKRITVLSTGIGPDNIDIVMHELDALANFDLKTRTEKSDRRVLSIIRIGTSGSIQPDVKINSFSLATHACGLDNLLYFYQGMKGVCDQEMSDAFTSQVDWHPDLSRPYFIKGDGKLVEKFRPFTVSGITVTAPGFYGPQGRFLRLPLTDPGMISRLQRFSYKEHRMINFEMETSALYGLGALMGHSMVTLCALIANRATGEYNSDHKSTIKRLIDLVIETL